MKALRLISPGNLKLLNNVKVPKVSDNSILLKVNYCGICSSDIKFIDKSHRIKKYPITLGHEISGTIEKIGKKVNNFKINDKIILGAEIPCGICHYCKTKRSDFCTNQKSVGTLLNGGFSEYLLLDSHFINFGPISKINKNDSLKYASLSESVACVFNGIENTKQNTFNSILILGCGYMGIVFAYVLSKKFKNKKILMVDNNFERIKYISKLKIASVYKKDFKDKNFITEILKKNDSNKFDFVISSNNLLISHELSMELVSKGGFVNLFGGIPRENDDILHISANKIHYDQIHLSGSFSSNKSQLQQAFKFINKNKSFFKNLITEVLDLDQALKYFNLVRENKVIKAIVKI